MDTLNKAFLDHDNAASQKVFVLYGMGGIGKTQLAANFARQQKNRFSAVFWLNASSKDALQQSLASAEIRLPTWKSGTRSDYALGSASVQESMDVVLKWLSTSGNNNWLVIYDNFDWDWEREWNKYSPQADQGNILITTRLEKPRRASLRVEKVDERLARKVLEARMWVDVSQENRLPIGSTDVNELLDELQGLPLALVQAGAYLRTTKMSILKYLQTYREKWTSLMESQDKTSLLEYGEQSVLMTWQVSYERVKSVKPEAAKLLDLWAFLSPDDIWDELATSTVDSDTYVGDIGSLSFLSGDDIMFFDCVRVLSQYSLVTGLTDKESYSIHSVLHAWSLHNVKLSGEEQLLSSFALRLVAARA